MSEKHISLNAAPCSLSTSFSSVASDEKPDCEEELEFDFGVYKGEVDPLSGLRSGQGELRYHSGNVYRGAWLDGAAHGYGEKRYANGDIYRGSWRFGKRCGKGGYLYAHGHYFEGHYCDDAPHGYGVLHTLQGDCYTGQWRRGKRHGFGRERLADGTCYTGHWRNGHKCGSGEQCGPGDRRTLRGLWSGDRYIGQGPVSARSGKGESAVGLSEVSSNITLPMENTAESDDMEGSYGGLMDLSAVSTSITEKASKDLSELEMRLEAVVAAMERAGIPDIT